MAPTSIVNNPAYQSQIAAKVAAGLNQETIADQLNINQTTVSRSVNLDSTKKLIELARNTIVNKYLPLAVDNMGQVLNDFYNKETKEYCKDSQVRYFGFRASEKMLESIGLMGSQTPSIFIQQIFNQQNVLVSPVIDQLLGLVRKDELPALDVEYEDK